MIRGQRQVKGVSSGILGHEPVPDIGFNDLGDGRHHL